MKKFSRMMLVSSLSLTLMLTSGVTAAFATPDVAPTPAAQPTITNVADGDITTMNAREQFVKDTLHFYNNKWGNRYNVLVFNTQQAHSWSFSGIQEETIVNYGSIYYKVWVFQSGTFRNGGHGGWINWGFLGNFIRNGSYVQFYNR
ncbi:hypothetical protein [Paenibacillus arenosi]|uniref:Stress protein n=1 Tax=Paenibacillus arenosi TaxID=2774142 RepID=A0ABR9B049_9BACL|nr:hypothetical protein [Paenibacillus arenosi]MBD8499710.1 hypothetical protein [Paenibacillus arenosi]